MAGREASLVSMAGRPVPLARMAGGVYAYPDGLAKGLDCLSISGEGMKGGKTLLRPLL